MSAMNEWNQCSAGLICRVWGAGELSRSSDNGERMVGRQIADLRGQRGCVRDLVTVMLLGAAVGMAVCDAASAQTLKEALAAAYRLNPQLDAERARQRATDEEVARANSGYRPFISGSADINYERRNTRPSSSNDGELHPKGYSLNLTQPIFRGFGRDADFPVSTHLAETVLSLPVHPYLSLRDLHRMAAAIRAAAGC